MTIIYNSFFFLSIPRNVQTIYSSDYVILHSHELNRMCTREALITSITQSDFTRRLECVGGSEGRKRGRREEERAITSSGTSLSADVSDFSEIYPMKR